MRRIVTSLLLALLIAILVPVAFTSAAINQHYTGEVVSVNGLQILTPSEIVALYPMPEELEAEIIHVEPGFRVNVDDIWYQPADISFFNGQRFHFTHDKSGGMYAFTDVYAMDLLLSRSMGFPSIVQPQTFPNWF